MYQHHPPPVRAVIARTSFKNVSGGVPWQTIAKGCPSNILSTNQKSRNQLYLYGHLDFVIAAFG